MGVYKRKPWAGSEDSFTFQVSRLTFKVQITHFVLPSTFGLRPSTCFAVFPFSPVPCPPFPVPYSHVVQASGDDYSCGDTLTAAQCLAFDPDHARHYFWRRGGDCNGGDQSRCRRVYSIAD